MITAQHNSAMTTSQWSSSLQHSHTTQHSTTSQRHRWTSPATVHCLTARPLHPCSNSATLSCHTTCHIMIITFCVSRRRCTMYCGHARLCVCVCVCLSAAVRPHYCTDPDVTWGRGRGCPLVVHYLADLQSGHGLHCYGNITRTLVTSLCPSRDMTT